MAFKKIAVHAGHNPDGMIACGAVGYMKESTAARNIAAILVGMFADNGYEVRDLTVNNGTSQQDVLNKLNAAVKEYAPDISISIHLNSFASADANGVEAYIYDPSNTGSEIYKVANSFCTYASEAMGYNIRGVKSGKLLSVIKNVSPPAVLFECGFVTNKADTQRFDATVFAKCIYEAVTGRISPSLPSGSDEVIPNDEESASVKTGLMRVQIGAYTQEANAQAMLTNAKKAGFTDAFISRT